MTLRVCLGLAATLATCFSATTPAFAEPTAAEVDRWLPGLSARRYAAREQASAQLAGLARRAPLRVARRLYQHWLSAPVLEGANRARQLLETLPPAAADSAPEAMLAAGYRLAPPGREHARWLRQLRKRGQSLEPANALEAALLGRPDWRERVASGLAAGRPDHLLRRLASIRPVTALQLAAEANRPLQLFELSSPELVQRARQMRHDDLDEEALRLEVAACWRDVEVLYDGDLRGKLAGRYQAALRAGMEPFVEERALHIVQDYATYRQRFPEGRYIAWARYAEIAGRERYLDETYVDTASPVDPARELEAWPRWLARFRDHPGADDAGYRLGRARELVGKPLQALDAYLAARRAGDRAPFRRDRIERRITLLLDAQLDAAQLRVVGESGRYPTALARRARACLPVQLLREGRFRAAQAALSVEDGRRANPVTRRWLATLIELQAKADAGDVDAAYQIARACYHNPGPFRGPETPAEVGGLKGLSDAERRRYRLTRTGRGLAQARFIRLAERLAGDEEQLTTLAKARYSAATAIAWLANHRAYGDMDRVMLARAIGHYARVIEAGGPLQDASVKAINNLTKLLN